MSRTSHLQVGIAALLLAIFLFLVGIPFGVTSPSNVQNIVLSPIFWPEILAGLLAVGGVGLILRSRKLDDSEHEPFLSDSRGGAIRLASMAALMVVYVQIIPVVGMVWSSMAAFAVLAFLIQTRHPTAALIASIAIPLLLYGFFAHVAGVAIPQGEWVRLP